MSPIWLVPGMIGVVGAAAVWALARGTAEAAHELADEVARFGELHLSLARLRDEVRRADRSVRDLQHR